MCVYVCVCMYVCMYVCVYLSIGCLRGCSFEESVRGIPKCSKASSLVGTLPTYIPNAINDRVNGVYLSMDTTTTTTTTTSSSSSSSSSRSTGANDNGMNSDSETETVSVLVNNGGKMISLKYFSHFIYSILGFFCALLFFSDRVFAYRNPFDRTVSLYNLTSPLGVQTVDLPSSSNDAFITGATLIAHLT